MDVSTLSGKVVLVTGAGSGIGRETALAFARRGADLVVCDVNETASARTADDIRALGRKAASHFVDVADRGRMRAFADAVHAEVEAVDVLVNNAGVGLGAAFLDTTLEDWDWIIGINLCGIVHGCHFFVPKMVARGRGGHVVNVASAAGYLASEALSAYSTTKFAVVGLSEALRDELKPRGDRRHRHLPGNHQTRRSRERRDCGAKRRFPARESGWSSSTAAEITVRSSSPRRSSRPSRATLRWRRSRRKPG